MKTWSTPLRITLLLGWILGVLLPLYSFRRFSTSYGLAFDWVFHTHASHVLMHTFLYAVLAALLASWVPRPACRPSRLLWIVLILIAMVAVCQEAIQMAPEGITLGADEVFDLVVDLNGGLLGTLLFLKLSRAAAT